MMNMKKVLRITIILIISLMIQTQIQLSYAAILDTDPSDFQPYSQTESQDKELAEKAGVIATVVRNVGIIVVVIMIMVIGIKMMIGSVEEKDKLKEMMPIYLLGAFMVIVMTWIPSIIEKVVNQ